MSDGIHIRDYGGVLPEGYEGPTWNTQELQRDFEVLGFGYGYCVVRRREDGQKGSVNFVHQPRVYFDFVPHTS